MLHYGVIKCDTVIPKKCSSGCSSHNDLQVVCLVLICGIRQRTERWVAGQKISCMISLAF